MNNYTNEILKHLNSGPTFSGGRISTFSGKLDNSPIDFNFKKINDPLDKKLILKFNKVIPSINKNYSNITKNYIYVYLNPFRPAPTEYGFNYKLPFPINGKTEIVFGYEPFYIGKGISSTGHRFNQHLANYLNKDFSDLENPEKQKLFKSIGLQMNQTNQGPKDWNDYKANWIKIIAEFDTPEQLAQAETALIRSIGSINGLKNGPLTNVLMTK